MNYIMEEWFRQQKRECLKEFNEKKFNDFVEINFIKEGLKYYNKLDYQEWSKDKVIERFYMINQDI